MKAKLISPHHQHYIALPSLVQQQRSRISFVSWLDAKRRALAAYSAAQHWNHGIEATIQDRRFDLEAKLHRTRIF